MTISKDDLHQYTGRFRYYRKTAMTTAFQLDAPHHIVTREGTLEAQAGDYCCVDSNGHPYPCAKDVFEATYEPANPK